MSIHDAITELASLYRQQRDLILQTNENLLGINASVQGFTSDLRELRALRAGAAPAPAQAVLP